MTLNRKKEGGKKTKGRKKKRKLSGKSCLKARNKQKREAKNKLPAEVGSPDDEVTSGNDVNTDTCENVSAENKCNQQTISSLFKKYEVSDFYFSVLIHKICYVPFSYYDLIADLLINYAFQIHEVTHYVTRTVESIC